MTLLPRALIVAGPTASGKSALAIAIAERLRGTVINADSMQVYRELRVLTAAPHFRTEKPRFRTRLYGIRPAAEFRQRRLVARPALSAMAKPTRPAACRSSPAAGDVFRRADRRARRNP